MPELVLPDRPAEPDEAAVAVEGEGGEEGGGEGEATATAPEGCVKVWVDVAMNGQNFAGCDLGVFYKAPPRPTTAETDYAEEGFEE